MEHIRTNCIFIEFYCQFGALACSVIVLRLLPMKPLHKVFHVKPAHDNVFVELLSITKQLDDMWQSCLHICVCVSGNDFFSSLLGIFNYTIVHMLNTRIIFNSRRFHV